MLKRRRRRRRRRRRKWRCGSCCLEVFAYYTQKGSIEPKKTSTLLEDDPTSRRTNNQSEESRSLLEENPRGRRSKTHTHTHTHNKHPKPTNNNPAKKTFKEKQILKKKLPFFSPEFVFLVVSTMETDLATIGKTPSWGRQQQPQSGELGFRTGLEGGGEDIVESVLYFRLLPYYTKTRVQIHKRENSGNPFERNDMKN
jgi:hypothetical protein